MRIPEAYELIAQESVQECRSEGYILRHKKTGAKVFLLSNDDRNKVFTIGFRTPPRDSTGLPHILEHSVLCGSGKFPVKDPFIELEKSSLQTFLNAMTYPDKTIYPVASCNDQDFRNLMDVYLDAVLHPNIYTQEKIFRQEGWHFEMEDADSPLFVNGVVYNEMKGAFSSPEDVLERYCQNVLYPDTPYTHESGGDPEVIPTLTYEDFLAFHAEYYHPSNSYIYLYGDMDMAEQLEWIHDNYLSEYDYREVHSEIPLQEPFAAPVEKILPYPIAPDEEEEDRTFLSVNWVTGDIRDGVEYIALGLLETVLLTAPGAPIREALIRAGIGEDISGGYAASSLQPYFNVVAINANLEQKEEFLRIVQETLKQQAEQGVDRKALHAALNIMEFKNREADFGGYPKGLMYGIQSFDSWLYDSTPFTHLKNTEAIRFLRENIDKGYFEELIRKYFLENDHRAVIVLVPERGLTERKDGEQAARMAERKAQMSPQEIRAAVAATRELKAYQAEASTPEQLACLPNLRLEDIDPRAEELFTRECRIGTIPTLHHDVPTSGIRYIRALFRADRIPQEELPYLELLTALMGQMPTENYSYSELFSEIQAETGGISAGIPVYQDLPDPTRYSVYMIVSCRVLKERTGKALELMKEMMLRTDFHDSRRLQDLLAQFRSRINSNLKNSGHSTALLRASSYASPIGWFNELTGGVEYWRFLEKLNEEIEKDPGKLEDIALHLDRLTALLVCREGMVVSITTDGEDYDSFAAEFGESMGELPETPVQGEEASGQEKEGLDPYRPGYAHWDFVLSKKNEGFRTAAQIQYVARVGSFAEAGIPYTGALRVMKKILSDEYLWTNVRVMGGAYGCMCNFGRAGEGYLVSYRDPNLGDTLKVYEGIVPWLENLEVTERDLNNYIIGTIGGMDRPKTPSALGSHSLSAYMSRLTDEFRQTERDQVLACTLEDLRNCAPAVRAVLDADQLCVVGNGGRIEEEKHLFRNLESLN